ncbi:MAG: zinc dependent phospholipase C family protein, partial [Candidatus Sulfotelmatobacter sp.]
SEDQLKEAHAYAYGGAVIQDLGYYPFGSREFSNLVHYVRSGDFVREMLLESHDVNEYAFALGALSHYAADIAGHPAVNQSVAIEYPKLRAKFGKSVRYAQSTTTAEPGFKFIVHFSMSFSTTSFRAPIPQTSSQGAMSKSGISRDY